MSSLSQTTSSSFAMRRLQSNTPRVLSNSVDETSTSLLGTRSRFSSQHDMDQSATSSTHGRSPTRTQRPSSLNSDDTLQRVSLMLFKHITHCEQSNRSNKVQQANGHLDFDQEEDFMVESNYIKPRFEYHFLRTPHLRLQSRYCIKKVEHEAKFPTSEEIYLFLKTLFCRAQLSGECGIVCLIYVERLMEVAKVNLLASNWRPITLVGLLLASKVWQDLSSWNIEFACVYPQYSLQNINKLEREFIEYLKWDLYISSSVYAKYYYGLCALDQASNFRAKYNFAIAVQKPPPHTIEIEQRSAEIRNSLHSRSMQRSVASRASPVR